MKNTPRIWLGFSWLVGLAISASALQVASGSACASSCLDPSKGHHNEFSCKDLNHLTTDADIKLKICLECLQASKKVSGDESDLNWFIYHIRFTVGTCLYRISRAGSNVSSASTCNIDEACKHVQPALTLTNVQPRVNDAWAYCAADDAAFKDPALSSCIQCLQVNEEEAYLSNLITALALGCRQKPSNGDLLNLGGFIFSTTAVSASNAEDVSLEHDAPSDGLSPGVTAGICLGVVVVYGIALVAFVLHFRREKALDARLREHGVPAPPHPRRSASTSPACLFDGDDSLATVPGFVGKTRVETYIPESPAIEQTHHAAAEYTNLSLNNPPKRSLPFLSRFRKQNAGPVHISLPIATSVAARQEYHEQIPAPTARDKERFHDCLTGVAQASGRPGGSPAQGVYYEGYFEDPLRSGKSALFGT